MTRCLNHTLVVCKCREAELKALRAELAETRVALVSVIKDLAKTVVDHQRIKLIEKVATHMDWRFEKAERWFALPNPMLGNVSPAEMISLGRADKLEKWIDSQIEEDRF